MTQIAAIDAAHLLAKGYALDIPARRLLEA